MLKRFVADDDLMGGELYIPECDPDTTTAALQSWTDRYAPWKPAPAAGNWPEYPAPHPVRQ